MKAEWTMEIPVISTRHVPSVEAMQELDSEHAAYEYGCFVWLGLPDVEFNGPEWLKKVADWLWLNYPGQSWVRFDCDADEIDELESWEW